MTHPVVASFVVMTRYLLHNERHFLMAFGRPQILMSKMRTFVGVLSCLKFVADTLLMEINLERKFTREFYVKSGKVSM